MAEHGYDELTRDLAALGRAVEVPAPSGGLETAVMVRVFALPEPRETESWWTGRRRVALAVAAVLLALLAAPPVRAAVADWFGFGGVRVEQGGSGAGTPGPPPEVASSENVREAADRVDFPVFVLEALGAPDGVEVSDDQRMVSMSWTTEEAGVLRLDQFDGRIDYSIIKRAPDVHYAAVDGGDALWFEEPHEVTVLLDDGTGVTHPARLAGHTLIWQYGATTLRLEGDVSLDRAVAIAESAEPLG